jgi:catechol 2,3-dioxygenase-like lactoylglutathione lyase family enzyme
VAGVEEARWPPRGQVLARHARPDAGGRIAAVLEDLGDVLDVLGLGDVVARRLRRLVGIQGPLVVGPLTGIQLVAGQLEVELLQLHAEGGDVLERQLLHRLELGGLLLQSALLAHLAGVAHDPEDDGEHEQDDQQLHGHRVRPGLKAVVGRLWSDGSMTTEIQVTFDCGDPAALAGFWCDVLGYVVQSPPPGFDSWEQALEAFGVPPERRNDASAAVDPHGVRPRFFFQKVPEGKTAKNRLHLDVRAAPGLEGEARMAALEARCEELVARGATRVERHEPSPPMAGGHIIMQDPEGNEFCLD